MNEHLKAIGKILEIPICTKCGYALDGVFVIGMGYHRDVCDGTKTVVLDLLKILLERGLMPEGTNWTP